MKNSYHLPEELRKRLENKRLIFTISMGRSGTKYLAQMLRYLPQVVVRHEPLPGFHEVMRDVQSNPNLAYEFLIEQKLPAIARFDEPTYIETSHIFGKGFFEPLVDLGIIPDLIIHRRNDRDVAKSLYQLNHVPVRTEIGLKYSLSPADPGVLPLPGWEDMHDYQLCYWQCLELERRRNLYAARLRVLGGQVAETHLDTITTIRGFYNLLRTFNLPLPRSLNLLRYLKHHRGRQNTKSKVKDYTRTANWDLLEAEVHEAIQAGLLEFSSTKLR